MNDTKSAAKKAFLDLMMKKTPEERLTMGCSMFMTAKAMVESSIRNGEKALSAREMKKKIFVRFYGTEFDVNVRKKILAQL